jgi:predicted nuclease of predicted toxin-antitoxin system
MRAFIDACIDPRIVEILVGHEAQTASDAGWQNLKDHILLPKVAAEFDVLPTADRGFEFEHNLTNCRSAS